MRKWFVPALLASCLLSAGCQSTLTSKSIPAYPGYTLVFADEFDGHALNPDNWTHEVGDRWHNNEQQAYTDRPENSCVRDGRLVIVARREDYHGRSFTSARIISKHKQDFLYGRIEARIQLPRGGGMWPAFWMMPSDDVYGTWAASGEIDIMEARDIPMEVRGNLHFGGRWPQNTSSGSSAYADGSDFSQGFHLYSIEWDPAEIRWYCDNQLYKTVNRWWTGGKEDNGTFPAPFDKRFYILLNVEAYPPETGSLTRLGFPCN